MKIRLIYICLFFLIGGNAKLLLGQDFILESVMLETDHSLYLAGESIRMKGWVRDAAKRAPSNLSKILRVELWDSKGTMHTRTKLKVDGGTASGFLDIPTEINTGYYQLRAYTWWMNNGDSQDFFYKKLIIANPNQPLPLLTDEPQAVLPSSTISLFPEGGYMVYGLENHIGIRLTDPLGRKKESLGRIEKQDGSIAGAFQTGKDGQGSFDFTPESGQNYYIRLLENADTTQVFRIPAPQDTGVVLRTSLDDARVLNLSVASRDITPDRLEVVLDKGGYVRKMGEIILRDNRGTLSFSCADLPYGSWLVHLKSENGTIYAARKIYISAREPLQVEVNLSSQSLSTGSEMVVDIYTKNASGNPVSADLALSVVKQSKLDTRHGLDMPMQEPSELDILNRHVQLSGNSLAGVILPELYGHTINGRVTNRIGEPVPGARVMLSFPGKVAYLRIRRADNKGRFSFLMDDEIYGVREICVNAADDNGNALNVNLDKDVWDDVPYPSTVSLSFSEEEANDLQELFVHNQLYRAYHPPAPVPVPPLRSVFQDPDKVYILDDFTRFDTEETFREIIYRVALRRKGNSFIFRVFDVYREVLLDQDPLIMVDGIPVSEANTLIAINSKLLEKVELISALYHLDDVIWYGMVHGITYKGDASVLKLPVSYLRSPWVFYSQEQKPEVITETKTPEGESIPETHLPDLRKRLHWDTKLRTDSKGHVQLRFSTSDVPGDFVVKASGMNEKGVWSEGKAEFSVQTMKNR